MQTLPRTSPMSVLPETLESVQLSGGAVPVHRTDDSKAARRQLGAELGHGLVLAAVFVTLLALQGSIWPALVIATLVAGICLVARYVSARALPSAVGGNTRAALAAMLAVVAVSIGGVWSPWFHVRVWVLVAVAGAAFAVSAQRERQGRRQRVLLVGGGDGSDALLTDAATLRDRFEIVAIVGEDVSDASARSVQHYPSLTEVSDAIETHRPDLVIVNVKKGRPELFQVLLDQSASGFRVLGLPEWYEHAFGRVPVAQVSVAWFMSLLHLYQRPYAGVAKRSFDVLVASIGILLTLPLFAVVAVLVRRPVLYRQVRVGQWGRPFTMYKFRTMNEEAEAAGVPEYAAVDDPRITRAGRFLRKTRLDELPQLWNVLIGEMSIVGPRPERPEFSALLEQVPWWLRRNMVKPGITGWAQINSGYAYDADSAAVKLSYDLWYLRHRSLLLDLVICLKTMPRLASGAGR
jgi:exopolysaccharide biosynthesis polyprenyl glycosylphosphotransferase